DGFRHGRFKGHFGSLSERKLKNLARWFSLVFHSVPSRHRIRWCQLYWVSHAPLTPQRMEFFPSFRRETMNLPTVDNESGSFSANAQNDDGRQSRAQHVLPPELAL